MTSVRRAGSIARLAINKEVVLVNGMVSEDVAREVVRRVAGSGRPLAASSRQFVQTYVDEDELLRAESGVA